MNVAIITGSRADWSGLGMLTKALQARGATVAIYALSSAAGAAAQADSLSWAKVWKTEEGDSPTWLVHDDMGRATGLATALTWVPPFDVAVLCGDRHETLIAAYVLAMRGTPIAHLAGGDVSGGSLDEGWRHAITKIATIHFPTHPEAAARIIRMGEDPARVHTFGSAAVDRVLATKLPGAAEIRMKLGLSPDLGDDTAPFVLVNWQPETPVDSGLPVVLQALDMLETPMSIVVVGANSDRGAAEANAMVARWVGQRLPSQARRVRFPSLPPALYLGALRHAHCLVGNSSSGYYEAPYFATPVIDIGNRQNGRLAPDCVKRVPAASGQIVEALQYFTGLDRYHREVTEAPYGDGHAAEQIADTILSYAGHWPTSKQFHD